MDTAVVVTIIFLILILVVSLVTLYTESRKHIRRLEDRIERLSNRLQAMNMKELDTVLKSIEYRKERDELYKLIEDMHSTSEALEDGRQIKIVPKLPRTPKPYLDKSNKLMTYEWEDGNTKYTSYYTYNPSQTGSQTSSNDNTPPQDSASPRDSSSYTGSGGDFSGGGSGGSWD